MDPIANEAARGDENDAAYKEVALQFRRSGPDGRVRSLTINVPFSIQNLARKLFFIESGFTACPNP